MTRLPSANEVLAIIARLSRVNVDDLDGYVIVLGYKAEVTGVLTNAADDTTVIAMLARAIEHRAAAIAKEEAST